MKLPVVTEDIRLCVSAEFRTAGHSQSVAERLYQTNDILYGNMEMLANARPQTAMHVRSIVICLCRLLELAAGSLPVVSTAAADRYQTELLSGGREHLVALLRRLNAEQPQLGDLVVQLAKGFTDMEDRMAVISAAVTTFRLLEIQAELDG